MTTIETLTALAARARNGEMIDTSTLSRLEIKTLRRLQAGLPAVAPVVTVATAARSARRVSRRTVCRCDGCGASDSTRCGCV